MSMSKPRRDFTLRLVLAFWALGTAAQAQEREARAILEAAGVTGGLVVHLGCGDGKLTAALRASDRFLVHGLDTDAAKVEKAREHILSRGLYGPVSVEAWNGERLPYADNLVNLLVCEYARGRVSESEVMRVLATGGVALSVNPKSQIENPESAKPRPPGMDEWTHFLHDASGNAVSRDSLVGPPKHLQWVGGPTWARSHEHLASVSALVSSAGRIFYIVDEGAIAAVT
ncbi:MAG: class I SAM-dependent methyltransferase, partial [Planctomycetes bacterium]|nr:class I SAM-dependent methyltransferase [Planctomycetota bacterium]